MTSPVSQSPEAAARIANIVLGALASPAPVANDDMQPDVPWAEDDAGVPDDGAPAGDDVPLDIIGANAALDQNDTDNGKRLLALFGARLLHVREIGMHAWEGRYWCAEGGDQMVERCAQDTARLMKLEARFIQPSPNAVPLIERANELAKKAPEDLTDEDRAAIKAGVGAADAVKKRKEGRRKFAISCGNRGRTVAMIAQAIPHRTVSPAALDADEMKFNVGNGTLVFSKYVVKEADPECPDPDAVRMIDVRKSAVDLRGHDPDDRISKIAAIDFAPAARSPKFVAFMERFQPDADTRRFLQVAAGRALLGGASTQVLVFLYGDGANGKSVFMETLAQVFHDYAGRLKPESITGTMEQGGDKATPDFARLQGKRFVAIAELPRGAPLREGLVKTMTGSEPMPVRHLNKGFFDMTPEFIPFMSGNQMPEIGGLDKGIWRRLKFVKWPVTLTEAEQRPLPQVVAEFMAEGPGILNWLIEGALIFLRDGLVDPAAVAALTQSHREDSDPIGAFTRDCVMAALGGQVQAREMYKAFTAYCEANAIKPWGEKTFSQAMKQKGFIRKDLRIRLWVDVVLHDVPMADPQPPVYGDPRG